MFKMPKELVAQIAARREELQAVKASLEGLYCDVSRLHENMTASYDEKSEGWQDGSRGQAVSCWLDDLDNLISNIESVSDAIGDLADELESAPVEPDYS